MASTRFARTAALFVTISASALSAQAAPIFFAGTGHFYEYILDDAITWDDANDAAQLLTFGGVAGHLATLTSPAEDAFVDANRGGISEFWVGGFQDPPGELVAGNGWTWVNGEGTFPGVNGGLVYANWLGLEPNDFGGPGSEQFLAIGLGNQFGWNDEGFLGNIRGYVVEYDTVPEPGTLALLGLGLASLVAWRRKRA